MKYMETWAYDFDKFIYHVFSALKFWVTICEGMVGGSSYIKIQSFTVYSP